REGARRQEGGSRANFRPGSNPISYARSRSARTTPKTIRPTTTSARRCIPTALVAAPPAVKVHAGVAGIVVGGGLGSLRSFEPYTVSSGPSLSGFGRTHGVGSTALCPPANQPDPFHAVPCRSRHGGL